MAIQKKLVGTKPKTEAKTASLFPKKLKSNLVWQKTLPLCDPISKRRRRPAPWHKEIDALKQFHQKMQDEMAVMRKHLEATEKTLQELETARREQQEAQEQRHRLEKSVHALEKKIAMLGEASRVDAAVKAVSSPAETPPPKMEQSPQTMFKEVVAQVITSAHTTEIGMAIESTLQLSGADAIRLTHQEVPFQIAWHARRLAGGESFSLLTTEAHLAANQLQYSLKTEGRRLPVGIYRLATAVSFPGVRHLMAYCQGPIIQINEV
jgi:hypothetical protein